MVKELRTLLDDEDGDLEVLVRPKLPGYELASQEFRIACITREFERDTAEAVIVLEVDQEQ